MIYVALIGPGLMRKRVIEKGNMRRGDFMRAVVTDTLPEEVPIVFSNDGFYRNTTNGLALTGPEAELATAILAGQVPYTIPYRYNVLRDHSTTRGLSLVHPAAQVKVADFYRDYDALICHYSRRSSLSLRAPHKVGSTYFVRGPGSERNSLKTHSIDTVDMEKTLSSPASYFSYNYIRRAHEFFGSNEYLHLEKKFKLFRMLDVSKCFNSIYTHTITWAVTDIKSAKDNTLASGFGNDFDRLMQGMNYNETNGICIGPEVSRVFAEIIFSDVDRAVVNRLSVSELTHKSDYDIRRYIDDFYVFAKSEQVADQVTAAIQAELLRFNLHLNHEKTSTILRPFSTKRSEVIAAVNAQLNVFFTKFVSYRSLGNSRFAYPRRVLRSDALIRGFVGGVKASCLMHDISYEAVSDYVVSALQNRVAEIVDGHQFGVIGDATEDDYIACVMVLLETSYFFYTVNPTVRASLNLARSIVSSGGLVKECYPARLPYLSESVVRWTLDLVKSIRGDARHRNLTAVPVEVLNVLIPMRDLANNEPLIDALVREICADIEQFEYFELVTILYLIGTSYENRHLRQRLFARAKKLVSSALGPRTDSQGAHLSLDLLSCPFLPVDKRGGWFNTLRSRCGLPKIGRLDAQAAVVRMEDHPWFVPWRGVDLASILKKKELNTVY